MRLDPKIRKLNQPRSSSERSTLIYLTYEQNKCRKNLVPRVLSLLPLSRMHPGNEVGTGANTDDVALYSVSDWLLLSSR